MILCFYKSTVNRLFRALYLLLIILNYFITTHVVYQIRPLIVCTFV